MCIVIEFVQAAHMEARYYDKLNNQIVRCSLCPHECLIHEGKSGICRVRSNKGGILIADTYNSLSAVNFDPIEKKPLYHFYPGKEIFSLGSLGCNFNCDCCQNYHISQTGVQGFPRIVNRNVKEIISMAKENSDNIGIAFTYNEPSVWFEFMIDIASESSRYGLKNVMVSNGYINTSPLKDLLQYVDAFNIDLKAFDDKVYKRFTGGKLENILETLRIISKQGKHLEITYLVVPGVNDDYSNIKKMVEWIKQNLGQTVPLHFSRYFPQYRMNTEATSYEMLVEMATIAKEHLYYVYIGNIPTDDFQDTTCPQCGELVIERHGYFISARNLNSKGQCSFCSFRIVKA